jgi:hypothetical protein
MNLMDTLLQQAANALGAKADDHFETQAQSAPGSVLGQSIASMFRSDETAPFGSMVGQLFGQSSAAQQAGVLNQLIAAAGPALLSSAAGGVLGQLMAPGTHQLTPEQASYLKPADVEQIAAEAERADPGVVDRIGHFYAEHPTLIKTLGSAALAIALAKLREHQQS